LIKNRTESVPLGEPIRYNKYMSKNPIINALSAASYIAIVVTVINFISQTHKDKPDTAFAPVVFLSLLTLSVTVMAYLFFYQPLQLFIEGKKKAALSLFVQTVGVFAIFTVVVLTLLLAGII
jgi:hypothetical protein